MLLIELENNRYQDLLYSGDITPVKQLFVITSNNKKYGPFKEEDGADKFIKGRTDLQNAHKKWV